MASDMWQPGMVIAVDTREQAPYNWPGRCARTTLATGDYAILGAEALAAVERKSLPDLLGSISGGRARFKREWDRLSEMRSAALVIEADLPGLLAGTDHSQMNPRAAIGTLASWSVRCGIPVWFAADRRHGAAMTALILRQVWRHHLTAEEREAAALAGVDAEKTGHTLATSSPQSHRVPPQNRPKQPPHEEDRARHVESVTSR